MQFINERTGLAKTLPKEATNVQHLTDATFNSIVMDPSKSALVEFYAPWCGHCKSLAPTYKKLADAFAGEEDVAIVAVDATENRATAEAYGVKGYPTLKWFPAGANKEAVDYAAGRDLDSFVEFINEHAGTSRYVAPAHVQRNHCFSPHLFLCISAAHLLVVCCPLRDA